MTLGASAPVPVRVQGAVYGAALFSNTIPNMTWVALPLWVLTFDVSPFMIGVALGCRNVLPVLLSIHGGALMDRLGTRRVMLFFGVISMISPLLFPLAPYIPALIALQLIGGLADSMGWIGAQTLVGQLMKGDAKYTGRMSFCTRIGMFSGPPLLGAGWDIFGPWGAFAMMSLWGGGIFLSTLLLPAAAAPAPHRGAPVTLRDLMPSAADYIAAFRLFAIPALAFVMLITVARHVGAAIQGSFYVVYLEGIGVSGTVIGLMMTAAGVLGLAGSLSAAPMLRFAATHWVLLWTTVATIVFVVITPLLENVPLLLVASGIRGWALAASLVFLISLIAHWAGPGVQGKAMGLRVTVNQLTSVIVPVVMGAVVEVAGIEASFYVVGVAALVMIALSGLWARRRGAFD